MQKCFLGKVVCLLIFTTYSFLLAASGTTSTSPNRAEINVDEKYIPLTTPVSFRSPLVRESSNNNRSNSSISDPISFKINLRGNIQIPANKFRCNPEGPCRAYWRNGRLISPSEADDTAVSEPYCSITFNQELNQTIINNRSGYTLRSTNFSFSTSNISTASQHKSNGNALPRTSLIINEINEAYTGSRSRVVNQIYCQNNNAGRYFDTSELFGERGVFGDAFTVAQENPHYIEEPDLPAESPASNSNGTTVTR